uniref:Uncharacterized protein n=1 Tax=Cucumis melo TaxID=3656 RepID=A0A9I9E616_CUCME
MKNDLGGVVNGITFDAASRDCSNGIGAKMEIPNSLNGGVDGDFDVEWRRIREKIGGAPLYGVIPASTIPSRTADCQFLRFEGLIGSAVEAGVNGATAAEDALARGSNVSGRRPLESSRILPETSNWNFREESRRVQEQELGICLIMWQRVDNRPFRLRRLCSRSNLLWEIPSRWTQISEEFGRADEAEKMSKNFSEQLTKIIFVHVEENELYGKRRVRTRGGVKRYQNTEVNRTSCTCTIKAQVRLTLP